MVANSVYENNDLRFETTATVELIIRLPTGGNTGERNSDLNFQLEHGSVKITRTYVKTLYIVDKNYDMSVLS